MANMGYCRFQNTLQALRDCGDHIDDNDLSDEEERARRALLELCCELALIAAAEEESDDAAGEGE